MPLLIDNPATASADLADLIHHCRSATFDPESRDSLMDVAPVLGALGHNRGFLAALALDALKDACHAQSLSNGYSPQVIMLSPPDGRFFVRANIWPSATDAMLRDTVPEAYYYHRPHDHAFDFLTLGYAGPGYWSDYYEYDGVVEGVAGETVDLRFMERSRLAEGSMLLYRANVDIHDQLPPDSLSVSINVMPMTASQAWRRQYFFDLSAGRIERCATITAAEILLPLSLRFGAEDARDLAEDFARRHADPRMRLAAWRALESARWDKDERAVRTERALGDDCALIRDHAGRMTQRLVNGSDSAGRIGPLWN